MRIRRIIVENFKNIRERKEILLDKLNLITGPVGAGKTTLVNHSIRFVLYGSSEVSLQELRTKGIKEKTVVSVEFDHNNKIYLISREIPTKITILVKDDFSDFVEVLSGANNRDKEEWIKENFKDQKYFERFRMIDIKNDSNILELGPTELRKTIISLSEELLNKVRKRLLDKKTEYSIYNKNNLEITSHFPSEKRYLLLTKEYSRTKEECFQIDKVLNEVNSDYNKKILDKKLVEKELSQVYKELEILNESNNVCPTCERVWEDEEKKQELSNLLNKKIEELSFLIEAESDNILQQITRINYYKDLQEKYYKKIRKIVLYRDLLEERMKLKDYKYDESDLLLIKKAIDYVDRFYSFYIVEVTKKLEPIINSVVNKINFEIEFDVDDKGKFNILLYREGEIFSYKDLSSGQKIMLNIAFQIAILLDNNDDSFIIADEGFSNLDSDTICSLYELFKELPFQVISVIHRFDENIKDVKIIEV